jgi:hypothetical protein
MALSPWWMSLPQLAHCYWPGQISKIIWGKSENMGTVDFYSATP